MERMRGLLWEAYSSPVGIEVASSDLISFKRRFYAERAKARAEGIYEFDALQLMTPPPDIQGKWWIVRNTDGQVQSEEQGEASQEGAEAL